LYRKASFFEIMTAPPNLPAMKSLPTRIALYTPGLDIPIAMAASAAVRMLKGFIKGEILPSDDHGKSSGSGYGGFADRVSVSDG